MMVKVLIETKWMLLVAALVVLANIIFVTLLINFLPLMNWFTEFIVSLPIAATNFLTIIWLGNGGTWRARRRLAMTEFRPTSLELEYLEYLLGVFASEFRYANNEKKRRDIAELYSHAVNWLIATGRWKEIPPLEDQLPREYMPEKFFQHWSV